MWENYGIQPPGKDHLVSGHKSDRLIVSQDYCPHVLNLSVEEKNKFFWDHSICLRCLFQPLSSFHGENTCDYTTRFPRSKCEDSTCMLRYMVCKNHKGRNLKKMIDRQKLNLHTGLKLSFWSIPKQRRDKEPSKPISMNTDAAAKIKKCDSAARKRIWEFYTKP